MFPSLLRLAAVSASAGLARSTIYLRVQQGLWTRGVCLGGRAVGWPTHEVEQLNAARIAGLSNDEIKRLVVSLHASRGASIDGAN
jgi:prophage regulatory protein